MENAIFEALLTAAGFLPLAMALAAMVLIGGLAVVCCREHDIWAGIIGIGACSLMLGAAWLDSSFKEDLAVSNGFPAAGPAAMSTAFLACLVFAGIAILGLVLVGLCRPNIVDDLPPADRSSHHTTATSRSSSTAGCHKAPVMTPAA